MKKVFSIILIILIGASCSTLKKTTTTASMAQSRIKELEILITKLEQKGINSYKEKLAIATSQEFLKYADWDERNEETNLAVFKNYKLYKDNAAAYAKNLPEFERKDVVLLLEKSIKQATDLLNGITTRENYRRPDWSNLEIKGNQILDNGKPVFLSDYTWQQSSEVLDEYFGSMDRSLIGPNDLINIQGDLKKSWLEKHKSGKTGEAGVVFISHTNMPVWTKQAYGEDFDTIMGKPFTHYDIDNPGARDVYAKLFKKTIPYFHKDKASQLGYMLINEPRWSNYVNRKKANWYGSEVSHYTTDKFVIWLVQKHGTLSNVNKIWQTNFDNYDELIASLPVEFAETGTPKWYDWSTFNEDRVTDWISFLITELKKYDNNARIHVKVMPSIFTDNNPDAGIDWEAIIELSGINGNDAASHYTMDRPSKATWMKDYSWNWRELFMGYDFLKSLQPDQVNMNSESHFLSGNHSRDLYMDPAYVRASYWSAHTLGLNATQTWYWPRRLDGSLRKGTLKGYAGSNNHQPRVTYEVENTLIDLNTYSEEITLFQNERKPLRLFYSKTSAKNKTEYMDEQFELYESLSFEGLSLGFVTQNVLKRIDHKEWNAVLIYKTPRVTQDELSQIQDYLYKGGVVFIDDESLKGDEYGFKLPELVASQGKIIRTTSLVEMKSKSLKYLENKNLLPEIELVENSGATSKKCLWRVITDTEGKHILSITSTGKETIELRIKTREDKELKGFKDIITGTTMEDDIVIKPYQVLFIKN
ncbi:beta-galactosidase [uncultured Aquimarina sp.]|uniref:beta-galactosidase n=1 Tax=uncultured Aquimarina sp. TaxID=575652 RepID=UPI00261EEE47|nr:beta-galactosidase [uncultured Aquimarina sp.]